jgi:hypothetical protein
MEVGGIAGQGDEAAGRKRFQPVAVELMPKPMWKTPDITVKTRSSGCRWGVTFTSDGTLTLIT